MGFWASTFGGSNDTLNKNIGVEGGLSSFLNNTGTSDVAASSNFMKTLLDGNSGNVAKLLSPQIEGVQSRAQQQKMQLGQFGTRSGGTTGAMLKADDDTHAQINAMIAHLTGTAVSNLGTMGQGLLSEGQQAISREDQESQQRMENWRNSILGKGLSMAATAAETYGLGAAAGAGVGGPGGGAAKGGQSALAGFLGGM